MTATKQLQDFDEVGPAKASDRQSIVALKVQLIDQIILGIQEKKRGVENALQGYLEESRQYRGTEIASPSASKKEQAQALAASLEDNACTRSLDIQKLRQLKEGVKKYDRCVLGALVQLQNQNGGSVCWYFLVSAGGGSSLLTNDGTHIVAISVEAPLAKKMITREVGEKVSHLVDGVVKTYEIIEIK